MAQTQTRSEGVPPRWRVLLRFALGQAQVMGATATAVLLFKRGLGPPVMWTVILTGVLSLVSIFLFRVWWRKAPSD
jgi:hypothetical protein